MITEEAFMNLNLILLRSACFQPLPWINFVEGGLDVLFSLMNWKTVITYHVPSP